jgi:hypothetical protein
VRTERSGSEFVADPVQGPDESEFSEDDDEPTLESATEEAEPVGIQHEGEGNRA